MRNPIQGFIDSLPEWARRFVFSKGNVTGASYPMTRAGLHGH